MLPPSLSSPKKLHLFPSLSGTVDPFRRAWKIKSNKHTISVINSQYFELIEWLAKDPLLQHLLYQMHLS